MSEFDDPTLADPDGEQETRYNWDEEFQRHVMALLISDRQFVLQSLELVKPTYFTNRAHQKVCSITFDFFRKHRFLPNKVFLAQELKTQLRESKSLSFYLAETNVLYDYFQPGLEARDYLQNKIVYFAKIQALKQAFQDSLDLINKAPEDEETWGKIYERMRESMNTHSNFDIGIDYFKSIKDRYAAMGDENAHKEVFLLGLQGIDKEIQGGGYGRGELISIVAASGVGKSVMLANLTATNLLRGKKGLYISLELAEHKIAGRMDAILSGFPIQNLFGHKDDIIAKLESLTGIDQDSMPLVIKQFPAGQASINTIRAYISQLRFMGFNPDFVVIDYVGEMAPVPGLPTHESREQIVRDLRGLATEENIFIATAMQPNRDAKNDQKNERNRIDDNHLADSYGQIRPLDGCFSLNQNDTEKKLGLGRAYVIKQRDGESRYQIYLAFDKESLRIIEITREDYLDKLNSHKEYVSDDVKVDMILKKGYKPPAEQDIEKEIGEDGWASFKEVAESGVDPEEP